MSGRQVPMPDDGRCRFEAPADGGRGGLAVHCRRAGVGGLVKGAQLEHPVEDRDAEAGRGKPRQCNSWEGVAYDRGRATAERA